MFEKLTAMQDGLPRHRLSCMAVTFQACLGQPVLHGCKLYPEWLWAFQACVGLHGGEAFLVQPILHGCELFNHLWDSLSCMAVSFSIISGRAYPAWPWAFQASLGKAILHGCQLFKHIPKPRYCQKLEKSKFSFFFIRISIRKSNRQNQILPKAAKIKFSIIF